MFVPCCLVSDYQLPADVLRLKERCAVTRRELAVRLGTPHVAHIKQSCDTKVGLWLKLITSNVSLQFSSSYFLLAL